jgi:proteic killer suppression protein
MIQGFACKETEKIYNGTHSRKLPNDIQRVARRKLIYLDEADNIEDLRVPPANYLEKLKRDRKGQWSIRINDKWRICFNWKGINASNVEIVDYH